MWCMQGRRSVEVSEGDAVAIRVNSADRDVKIAILPTHLLCATLPSVPPQRLTQVGSQLAVPSLPMTDSVKSSITVMCC